MPHRLRRCGIVAAPLLLGSETVELLVGGSPGDVADEAQNLSFEESVAVVMKLGDSDFGVVNQLLQARCRQWSFLPEQEFDDLHLRRVDDAGGDALPVEVVAPAGRHLTAPHGLGQARGAAWRAKTEGEVVGVAEEVVIASETRAGRATKLGGFTPPLPP